LIGIYDPRAEGPSESPLKNGAGFITLANRRKYFKRNTLAVGARVGMAPRNIPLETVWVAWGGLSENASRESALRK
jgi:hypothetical protein